MVETTGGGSNGPAAKLPDLACIVEQIRAGDRSGAEALYHLVSRGLRLSLLRQLGAQEADDILHSVMVITIQAVQRGGLRDPERLLGFMSTVAHRQVAGYIQSAVKDRGDRRVDEGPKAVVDGRANPEQQVISEQRILLMRKALSELSPKDREVLMRFYVRGESAEQICREMNWTETQFRLLKSRAKSKIAEKGKRYLKRPIAPLCTRDSSRV
jgi:RNA polymerase sigma-70 factor (ECF subfamily)